MIDEEQSDADQESIFRALDYLGTDRFYHGVIYRLFRGKLGGVVRANSGREIPFQFQHVTIVGDRRRFEDLREGMRVGYDVGWTSHGLRVTVLRLPPDLRTAGS